MDLTPKLPPGRANRKALAFSAEIHRLRAAGYSFEAIRLALLDAGVEVSRTTVKREAARRCLAEPTAPQRRTAQSEVATHPSPSPAADAVAPATSFAGDSRSGKVIAEAFMKGRISNPLIRERIDDEGRRDQLLGQRRQDHDRPSSTGAADSRGAGAVDRKHQLGQ